MYVLEKENGNWGSIKSSFLNYCDSLKWIPVYNYSPTLDSQNICIPTNQIMIKYLSSTSSTQIDSLESLYELTESSRTFPDYLTLYNMDSTNTASPISLSMALDTLSLVEWANFVSYSNIELQVDPLYSDQWFLNNTQQIDANSWLDINAPEAWTITKGDPDIVIAIIDSGIDGNEPWDSNPHEDFALGQVLQGYSTSANCTSNTYGRPCDENSHGQQVAGIIGAQHNEIGVRGIAPDCKILPINFFPMPDYTPFPPFDNASIIFVLDWAWNRADIVSNSWVMSYYDPDYYDPGIVEVIDQGAENGRDGKGTVFCFAAGNNSNAIPGFPASINNTISVGGALHDGENYYPNDVTGIDIVAPTSGGDDDGIVTTDYMGSSGENPNGNYIDSFCCTSAATPQIAAVSALILSVDPSLENSEVEQVLYSNAIELDASENWDGNGSVDAFASLISLFCCGDVDKDRYDDTEANGLDDDDSYLVADFIMDNVTPDFAQEELADHDDDDSIDVLDAVAVVGHKNAEVCEAVGLARANEHECDNCYGDITISSPERLSRSEEVEVIIEINSEVPVEGFQFDLEFDTNTLRFVRYETTNYTDSFITYSKVIENYVRILSFNDGSDPIPQGDQHVISLYFIDQLPRDNYKHEFILLDKVLSSSDGERIQTSGGPSVPEKFLIHPAYPNPFNPITTISFEIPMESQVTIGIFDISGRSIAVLSNEIFQPGYHSVNWEAAGYASGIYFVKLVTPEYTETQKVMLLK